MAFDQPNTSGNMEFITFHVDDDFQEHLPLTRSEAGDLTMGIVDYQREQLTPHLTDTNEHLLIHSDVSSFDDSSEGNECVSSEERNWDDGKRRIETDLMLNIDGQVTKRVKFGYRETRGITRTSPTNMGMMNVPQMYRGMTYDEELPNDNNEVRNEQDFFNGENEGDDELPSDNQEVRNEQDFFNGENEGDDEIEDNQEGSDESDNLANTINVRQNAARKLVSYKDFILDEAEVDDEMEEEEDSETGSRTGVMESEEDGPTAQQIERRREIPLNPVEEDSYLNFLAEKYSKPLSPGEDSTAFDDEVYDDGVNPAILEQVLLPTNSDPRMWIVKCRRGEERKTAHLLLRKCLTFAKTETPLLITSVVVREEAKGYIYVEAQKQCRVKDAIQDVRSLQLGDKFHNIKLVPINEMPDTLRVSRKETKVEIGQWVELKSGTYRNDVGRIHRIDLAEKEVHVKFVPRIDYLKFRGTMRVLNKNPHPKPRSTDRPDRKLFDRKAIEDIGGNVTFDREFYMFEGNRYSRDGFVIKKVSLNSIVTTGVKPTLADLEFFEPDLMLSEPDTNFPTETAKSFTVGDRVRVLEGELMHLVGRVVDVSRESVFIKIEHQLLPERLQFRESELQKCFEVGDHVTVFEGTHAGETGFVVKANENIVTVYSALHHHEFQTNPNYLNLLGNYSSPPNRSLGQFRWGDIVGLDQHVAGVVIKVERCNLQVLNMFDKVLVVKPQSLQKKRLSNAHQSVDSQNQLIRLNTWVQVINGLHKGREGQVKFVHRNYVFLHSKAFYENSGFFACPSSHLSLAQSTRKCEINPMHNPLISCVPSSPHLADNTVRRNTYSARDMEVIGSTVKIIAGNYKGNVGVIKDVTDTIVRVELHASCQTIAVDKSRVAFINQSSMLTPPGSCWTPMYATPSAGNQTPLNRDGMRTPNSVSGILAVGTPSSGGATPFWTGCSTPGSTWEFGNNYL